METKFNFNSQICTTREQSELLLSSGLKKETADMFHAAIHIGTKIVGYQVSPIYNEYNFEIFPDDIPAWSLNRLWELTPKVIFTKPSLYLAMCENLVIYCAGDNNEEYEQSFSRQVSLYDNIIDCIKWLIKEGYFNEEYLV